MTKILKGLHVSILKNAIDSIQIGVEDFENADERRSVSAVRNISAGLLLLYKEKLCRLSPAHDKELLIKENILPVQDADENIIFKGKGTKTVDVQTIEERFISLNVYADWKRFKEINKLRNELEHYFTSKSPDAVREVIAKSFLLIRDFLVTELDENPQDLIGNECWASLLNVSEVYSAEEAACKNSIEKIDWKYASVKESLIHLRCPECNSALIQAPSDDNEYPAIDLHCKSCNHEFSFNDVIEYCIDELLSGSQHRSVKDGGDYLYESCPECNQETFIHAEDCCVSCGYGMEYIACENCGESLTLEEQINEGTCSYCQYQLEKMRDD